MLQKTIEYKIDTIGSNTIKGVFIRHSIDTKTDPAQLIKANHKYVYRTMAPQVPLEEVLKDAQWMIDHGAISVEIEKQKINEKYN